MIDIEELLSKLQEDELLIIHCYDNRERGTIHAYLNGVYPNIGHIGTSLSCFPCDEKLRKCKMCKRLITLQETESKCYNGRCDMCDISIQCDKDDYKIIHRNKNNAMCIGSAIHIVSPLKFVDKHYNKNSVNVILEKCDYFIIKIIPGWTFHGSWGRKGRIKLKRKLNRLNDHILQNVNLV